MQLTSLQIKTIQNALQLKRAGLELTRDSVPREYDTLGGREVWRKCMQDQIDDCNSAFDAVDKL